MKRSLFIFLFFLVSLVSESFLSLLCLGGNNVSQADVRFGKIHVVATGFRNKKGIAQFTLFNSEKGFPDQVRFAFRTKSIPLSADRVEAVFEKIPIGIYAVGALHDENSNGILDKNIIGIPKEGTGASSNARGKMGPPSFEDAKFEVSAESVTIEIRIFY